MTSCKQISQINDNPSLKQLHHCVNADAENSRRNLKYNRCLLLIMPKLLVKTGKNLISTESCCHD